MIEVDWSKAPENTKGALVTKDLNIHHPEIVFASGHHLTGCMIRATAADDGRSLSAPIDCWYWVDRPAPAWNGEWLPPVGTVCEWRHNPWDSWHVATVLYVGKVYVIVTAPGGEQHYYLSALSFRPIRTPEQIAADDRLHKIRNACTAIARTLEQFDRDIPGGSAARVVIEAMIDAGYKIPDELAERAGQ